MANQAPCMVLPPHARVRSGHQLAQGLIAFWPGRSSGGGAFVQDAVRPGSRATLIGSAVHGAGFYYFDGTSGCAGFADISTIRPAAGVTLAVRMLTTGLSSPLEQVFRSSSVTVGVTGGFQMARNVTAGTTSFLINAAGGTNNYTFTDCANPPGLQYNDYVGTWDGSVQKMYLDGTLKASLNTSGTLTYDAGATSVFGASGANTLILSARFAYVGIWSRALRPEEVMSLTVDPYAMLRQPLPRGRVALAAATSPFFFSRYVASRRGVAA